MKKSLPGLAKAISETLPVWLQNHPCNRETFWHVQNAIGDIVGWPEWYTKLVTKMLAKYPKEFLLPDEKGEL
jgi:hypothetical protein